LEEFVEIAKSEKVISERELVEAFRSIDIDNNGYLSYREFVNLFTNVSCLNSKRFFRELSFIIICLLYVKGGRQNEWK
jgi:Ca2+-binding EF-hand superfamily protein